MKKPTPEKMSALQGKSAKQLAMAVRAHQKTIGPLILITFLL